MAQKGMSSVGLNIPVDIRKHNVSIGIGAKYQYNFTDYFRMEAAASYSPINISSTFTEIYSERTWYDIEKAHVVLQGSIAGHFFFVSPRPVRPFIVLGVGFASHKSKYIFHNKYRYNNVDVVIEESEEAKGESVRPMLGIGLDVRLNYKWILQISAMAVKPLFLGGARHGYKEAEFNGMANFSILYNL